MFIRVRHQIRYVYDRPVFIEPKTIRLTPKQDSAQRLLAHALSITPTPAGQTDTIEQDGTVARIAWFSEEHATLTIEVDSIVQTLRENPYDGIVIHQPATTLPVEYPPVMREALGLAEPSTVDPSVRAWSDERAAAAGRGTLKFLLELTDWIHQNCRMNARTDGEPFTPEQTLAERCGACRDVAMLFVAACRAQGIAARFVSGYSLHHPPETTEHELHAWAEVYLPGLGWRGYDPSLGLATADGYIVLATAPDHWLAAPTTGTYRGTGVGSSLSYEIEISSAETAEALAAL